MFWVCVAFVAMVRRGTREAAVKREVGRVVDALAWLVGREGGELANSLLEEDANHIYRVVEKLGHRGSAPSHEAALKKLLGARGPLSYEAAADAQGSVAPYQRGLVSRNESAGSAPPLRDLLVPDDRDLLDEFKERLLLSDAEVEEINETLGEVEPYTDVRFKARPRLYHGFGLFEINTKLVWSLSCEPTR